MTTDRDLFYFIDHSLSILLVDDDPGIQALVQEILKPINLFTVHVASSAAEAEKVLSSFERTHLCILDLGITDLEDDEFYLLKKYGSRVSFVIFTGSTSPAKGYEARGFGARAIVEKSQRFDRDAFVKTINRYALQNVINPRHGIVNDTLSKSTDVLFDKSPKFVSQWAIQMGITDRELRHIWTKNLGANAKIILSIYQLFSEALNYYERLAMSTDPDKKFKVRSASTYKRLEEYFHMHRSTITDFIAYGNVSI